MNEEVGLKHVTLPIISILMILGNGVLILVTLRNKNLRTVTNFFVASLALCDLLMGCLVIPLVVLAEEGLLGRSPQVCLAVFCLTISNLLVSCLMLMAIAVERFVAIVCPLRHHALSTGRNAAMVITFCWTYSILVGCLPLAGWNVATNPTPTHGTTTSGSGLGNITSTGSENTTTGEESAEKGECRYHTVIGASFAAFMYPGHFVPLWVLMLVLYGQIYMRSRGYIGGSATQKNVRRWSTTLYQKNSPYTSRGGKNPRARENWRAMRILAVLVGYFVLSWLPVVIWYGTLYRGFTVEDARRIEPILPYWFYNMGVTLAYGNSAVNPILYGFGNRSVRKSLLQSLCGSFKAGSPVPATPAIEVGLGKSPEARNRLKD